VIKKALSFIWNIIKWLFIIAFLLLLLIYFYYMFKWSGETKDNMSFLTESPRQIVQADFGFRDLNKNGRLDPYEDSRQSVDIRVENLLAQMTIEEKAGLMFINMTSMSKDGSLFEKPKLNEPISFFLETNSSLVGAKNMNHFNLLDAYEPEAFVKWNNNIQSLAEKTRLGIPVTIATDPRHTAVENPGASIFTPFFSRWPSPLGMGAINDTTIVRQFGDIARQEYKALGFRLALHPMADLATEPRWARVGGTFGEDAGLSARLTKAYILGFQGDSLNATSVACMTKHFSGGGPQKDGEDAHFHYGKDQVYPGDNFDYHLIPFQEGAFAAHTAQIMPYYGIPQGQTEENVGFAFNKEIISDLLRDSFNFDGVVCTDWGLISDKKIKKAAAWGLEDKTELQRVEKILNAGCDMFGGESCPEHIVNLVKQNRISESRIDDSVRRILRDKFVLGLFNDPYVNIDGLRILDNEEYRALGRQAQKKSFVLLKNEDNILPLDETKTIFLQGFDRPALGDYRKVMTNLTQADYVILKLKTPYEARDSEMLEQFFHQGTLEFTGQEKQDILELLRSKKTITVISIDRPAVIPQIAEESVALIADFNCEEDLILDLIYGKFNPTGKLPIEMPSSMKAVKAQKEDLPYDSVDPLFPFGHGLNYFEQ